MRGDPKGVRSVDGNPLLTSRVRRNSTNLGSPMPLASTARRLPRLRDLFDGSHASGEGEPDLPTCESDIFALGYNRLVTPSLWNALIPSDLTHSGLTARYVDWLVSNGPPTPQGVLRFSVAVSY